MWPSLPWVWPTATSPTYRFRELELRFLLAVRRAAVATASSRSSLREAVAQDCTSTTRLRSTSSCSRGKWTLRLAANDVWLDRGTSCMFRAEWRTPSLCEVSRQPRSRPTPPPVRRRLSWPLLSSSLNDKHRWPGCEGTTSPTGPARCRCRTRTPAAGGRSVAGAGMRRSSYARTCVSEMSAAVRGEHVAAAHLDGRLERLISIKAAADRPR